MKADLQLLAQPQRLCSQSAAGISSWSGPTDTVPASSATTRSNCQEEEVRPQEGKRTITAERFVGQRNGRQAE